MVQATSSHILGAKITQTERRIKQNTFVFHHFFQEHIHKPHYQTNTRGHSDIWIAFMKLTGACRKSKKAAFFENNQSYSILITGRRPATSHRYRSFPVTIRNFV